MHIHTYLHACIPAYMYVQKMYPHTLAAVQIDQKLAQVKDLFTREIKAKIPPTDVTPAKPQTAQTTASTNSQKKGVKNVSGKSSPIGRAALLDDQNNVFVKLTLQECGKIAQMVDWNRVCEYYCARCDCISDCERIYACILCVLIACICIGVNTCMHICVCVCVYVYIYIYIYICMRA